VKGKTDIEVIKELRSQLKYVDHIIIFVYHHKIYVQTILVSKSNQMKFQGDFCRGYHFAPGYYITKTSSIALYK
jgi:hypothetical protein